MLINVEDYILQNKYNDFTNWKITNRAGNKLFYSSIFNDLWLKM